MLNTILRLKGYFRRVFTRKEIIFLFIKALIFILIPVFIMNIMIVNIVRILETIITDFGLTLTLLLFIA